MTGFAEAVEENGQRRFDVVVQGWNHRHLDVVVRLPEELRAREAEIRERLGRRILRGRCDLSIRAVAPGGRRTRVRIDLDAIRDLHEQVGGLVSEGRVEPTLALGDLLRSSQLVTLEPEPLDWTESDQELLDRALERALDGFEATRGSEGERLAAILERGRARLCELVDELEGRRVEVVERIGSTWRSRLEEILSVAGEAVPADRVAQEVALLIERGDVREELDRLRAHLEHFFEAAAGEGAIGKRLDFLAQEILRELNTLGAKSRDAEIARLVVEAKVVCEQLREQIQNVE